MQAVINEFKILLLQKNTMRTITAIMIAAIAPGTISHLWQKKQLYTLGDSFII